MVLDTADANTTLPAVFSVFLVSCVKGLTMAKLTKRPIIRIEKKPKKPIDFGILKRGEAYVVSYLKTEEVKAPFRTILVCSVQADRVYAIPAELIAEYEAEREVCRKLECGFFSERPNPQTFKKDRFLCISTKVAKYRPYMDSKVAKKVKSKLDMVENAR